MVEAVRLERADERRPLYNTRPPRVQAAFAIINRRAPAAVDPVRVVRQGRGADVDEAPLVQAVEAARGVERQALVVPVPGLAQRAPERVGPAARAAEQLGPPPRLDP